ncbi:MAG: sensor histidine kinase [Gammaproteobacteria bacterium]|nr:sensor histidine kinase [Gammaproteobacteria bacterium]
MNLQTRLSLVILAIFLLVMTMATGVAIRSAQRAVAADTAATGRLVTEIIAALAGGNPDGVVFASVSAQLRQFAERHHLELAEVPVSSAPPTGAQVQQVAVAPGWFRRLVTPAANQQRAVIGAARAIGVTVSPEAEINEAWSEFRTLLSVILVFAVLTTALVFGGIRRGLRPLAGIIDGLVEIGRGNYAARLTRPGLPELRRVVDHVNGIATDLEQARQHALSLARRNLQIQEEERSYLARELHDELGQSLSAIKAVAVYIDQRARHADLELAASARTIADITNDVFGIVRRMMHRLKPAALSKHGLVPALEQLVDDWNARQSEVFCSLELKRVAGSAGESTAVALYRVVQEALTNVVRHANAQRVTVTLDIPPQESLSLIIEDDGCGFDVRGQAAGFGLAGIRERVLAAGGRCTLTTAPTKGTRIEVVIARPVHTKGSQA